MSHDTPARCPEPDPLQPGRCPLMADESGRCQGHQPKSRFVIDESWPEAPLLKEMREVAIEARELMMLDQADPERTQRFEARKRDLLAALREW